MKINRYLMTAEEDEDTTRYNAVRGSQLLRQVADLLTTSFYGGTPLAEAELREAHDDLAEVWNILISETLHGIAPSEDCCDGCELENHYCFYSDGSALVDFNTDDGDPLEHVPTHFREQSISYTPNNAAWGDADLRPYAACEGVLEPPPHERMDRDEIEVVR